MLNVAVSGASGKMGLRVVALIKEHHKMRLAQAVEKADSAQLGADAGTLAGVGMLGVKIQNEIKPGCDVAIDFSSPAATLALAEKCVTYKTALVSGTTGLGNDIEKLKEFSKKIPVLVAPNMSVSMNLLFKIVGEVARVLQEGYDVEIVETHHRYKADSPSGSALRLAEHIADALNRNHEEAFKYGRHGNIGPRKAEEIGIHAVRSGDVVGEHTVIFGGLGDRLEITHRATSRDIFARGAIRAAEFIAHAAPGMYSMDDVLKLPTK